MFFHFQLQTFNYLRVKTRVLKNNIFFYFVCIFSGITMLPLFFILFELLKKGYKQFNFALFTEIAPTSMDAMLAKMTGDSIPGGVLNGITGGILIIGVSIIIAIPIGIFAGIYLSEHANSAFASVVRYLTDLIQGTPSIVIGIIAYAWVVKPLHSYSALAGSVALAIMMLPLIIRSTEETLKLLPGTLKEAGLALGASYTNVIFKVMLPSAFGGLFTGILLAVSRVMGETAPLMLTALGASAVNWNIFEPTSSIPLLIWEFYNDPNLIDMIWSSSLLLLLLILVLNFIAKHMAEKWRIN